MEKTLDELNYHTLELLRDEELKRKIYQEIYLNDLITFYVSPNACKEYSQDKPQLIMV